MFTDLHEEKASGRPWERSFRQGRSLRVIISPKNASEVGSRGKRWTPSLEKASNPRNGEIAAFI